MKITTVTITPIAFTDPPLLNSRGVHEPLALRSIVQLEVGDSVVGLGEGSGDLSVLDALRAAAPALVGMSVLDLNGIERVIGEAIADGDARARSSGRQAFSIVEVACHDALGRLWNVPVSDLLGGAVREEVAFAAYLFSKWGGHPDAPGDDPWGAAKPPSGSRSVSTD